MKTAKNYDFIAFFGIAACLWFAMNGAPLMLCAVVGSALGCLVDNPDKPPS